MEYLKADAGSNLKQLFSKGKRAVGLLERFLEQISDNPARYKVEIDDRNVMYMKLLPSKENNSRKNSEDESSDNVYPDLENPEGSNQVDNNSNEESEARVDVVLLDAELNEDHTKKYENVLFDDKTLNDLIKDYIKNELKINSNGSYEKIVEVDSNGNPVNSSKVMKVKLKKVVSSKETSIDLVKIQASYDAGEAQSDLIYLLEDPSLFESISEDGTNLEVTSTPDSFEIQDCGEVDVSMPEVCSYVMSVAIRNMFNFRYLSYIASGENAPSARDTCSCLEWMLSDMIDTFAKLSVEYGSYAVNPSLSVDTTSALQFDGPVSSECVLNNVRTGLLELSGALELYYCDMPHDVQALFDGWIRSISSHVSIINLNLNITS